MYLKNQCSCAGCKKPAISNIDDKGNLIETSQFCWKHTTNSEEVKDRLFKYLQEHEKVVGVNFSGMTFDKIQLEGHKFYGCDFSHCFFQNLNCTKLRFRMCKFDFAVFNDCNLLESNVQFTSFSGAKFIRVLFTGSDLIQNNFNGIASYQSSFDDSDRYNSRFIRARLVDTSIRNCNVKKTMFYEIQQNNVSYKLSNTNEAIFDKTGSALFTGDNSAENSITGVPV